MKYIIIHDFFATFKKHIKIYLVSIFVLALYTFYLIHYINEENLILWYRGIIMDKNYIVVISFYIFHVILLFYIGIYVYINGLRLGHDYLFSRMSFKKWNICKIVSMLLNIILIEFVILFIFQIIAARTITPIQYLYLIMNDILIFNMIVCFIQGYIYKDYWNIIFMVYFICLYIYIGFGSGLYINKYFMGINILFLLVNTVRLTHKKVSNIVMNLGE